MLAAHAARRFQFDAQCAYFSLAGRPSARAHERAHTARRVAQTPRNAGPLALPAVEGKGGGVGAAAEAARAGGVVEGGRREGADESVIRGWSGTSGPRMQSFGVLSGSCLRPFASDSSGRWTSDARVADPPSVNELCHGRRATGWRDRVGEGE